MKYDITAKIMLALLIIFGSNSVLAKTTCYQGTYIVGVGTSTGNENKRFRIFLSDRPGGQSTATIYSYRYTSEEIGRTAFIAAINAMNFQFPVSIEMDSCKGEFFFGITQMLKPNTIR